MRVGRWTQRHYGLRHQLETACIQRIVNLADNLHIVNATDNAVVLLIVDLNTIATVIFRRRGKPPSAKSSPQRGPSSVRFIGATPALTVIWCALIAF